MENYDDRRIKEICSRFFDVSTDEIANINVIKTGLNNKNYTFTVKNSKYVIRIPYDFEKPKEKLFCEHKIIDMLSQYDITEKLCLYDDNTGIKISEFINNGFPADISKENELKLCLKAIDDFHSLPLNQEGILHINPISIIENFEGKIKNPEENIQELKRKIYKAYSIYEKSIKNIGIVHFDCHRDNFLITDKRNYILDWEFAGIFDRDIDIAAFIAYEYLPQKRVDYIIDCYFENQSFDRKKIYTYIALMGFLWYSWASTVTHIDLEGFKKDMLLYAKEYINLI